MITREKYIEYLICTPVNYTCTNLSDHTGNISHDSVSDFLKKQRITPRHLWNEVKNILHNSDESCLIIDDSVQNKQYSRSIELVKLQYSGAAGGTVRGIGVVNLVHTDGKEHCPIDYRIYSKETDGKTKNDHFKEMLINAVGDKGLKAKRVLFDSWYSAWDNLKLINTLGLFFYTTLKSNRLVSLSREEGWIHLQEVNWTAERLRSGVVVKLKKVPFKVKLFKLVAQNGDIDWLITNEPDETLTAQVVKGINDRRWKVEEFHRELKQLTGSERCQCRKARSQRNHIACCYHAWLSLKMYAAKMKSTVYQVRTALFSDYLAHELACPRIRAYAAS